MLKRQLAFTFCIYINLVALFCVSAHIQEFKDAHAQILPAYIIASKADQLNSTTCGKELQNFRDAVDQRILWSLKVLDSSGVFKPGFLYGNNYWLGSRSQCLDTMNRNPLLISQREILNNTLFRDSQKEFPPFQVNYFVAHFQHNSTLQYHINMYNEVIVTLGLCLPASCSINELSFILEKIFHDRVILINNLYSVDFQLIQVKDLKDDNKWLFNGASCFICVCLGFSFLMTIIGTIYDIFIYQKNIKKNEINKTDDGMENESNEIKMKVNLFSHRENKIGKVLICFSVYTNTKKIFNMKVHNGTVSVTHGLKFLTMCFTIFGHTIYFTLDSLDNKVWFFRFIEQYCAYLTNVISISVDNFFFLSGFLMTYLFTTSSLYDKTNNKLNNSIDYKEKLIDLFVLILRRFIRVTPTYMMVLGITQLTSTWFDKTSLFYTYERSHETCSKYWWRNLLYINNFFGLHDMCMSWSWYLANDMQFYIIASMLLILSTTHFYTTVTILNALLIGSTILCGYISYIYEYIPTVDELVKLLDVLYYSPWMRINPYIIGIISGYILTKLNNNLILKKEIIILCWCFAGACSISILFYKQSTILATAIYIALHRILWAISIAWIMIACSTNHGGIVNQLLSFKGWIPLSRLTYCAYLLNPVIIRWINSYSETSTHFEVLPFVVLCVGYIVITYFCSYMLSLIVEVPYILLTQIFIQYFNRTHRKIL